MKNTVDETTNKRQIYSFRMHYQQLQDSGRTIIDLKSANLGKLGRISILSKGLARLLALMATIVLHAGFCSKAIAQWQID